MTLAYLRVFVKDPDDTLDYEVPWADFLSGGTAALVATPDTLQSVTWVGFSGITKVSDSFDALTGTATVMVSGGTAGQDYPVTCRITTVGGRHADRSILFQVRQR